MQVVIVSDLVKFLYRLLVETGGWLCGCANDPFEIIKYNIV